MSNTCKFGIFEIDGGLFAVDVQHVSEVVPFQLCSGFFSASDAVIGSLDLRGWPVPVIDLLAHVKQRASALQPESVLVLRNEGQLLGVAIRSVVGMQDMNTESIASFGNPDAVMCGSFMASSLNKSVTLLSASKLMSDPALPAVPAPPQIVAEQSGNGASDKRTIMLVTVRNRLVAFFAEDIFSTLTETNVVDRAHHSESFLGEVEHQGKRIPILDLGNLVFEQPRADDVAKLPSVILHIGDAQVGLCVDSIVEVTEIEHSHCIANMANHYTGKKWVDSLLPVTSVQSESLALVNINAPLIMLISANSIGHLDEIKGTAMLCREMSGKLTKTQLQRDLSKEKQGLFFDIGSPVISDMSNISEILSWETPMIPLTDNGYLLGMIKVNNEAVPVYDFRPLFNKGSDYVDTPSQDTQLGNDSKRLLLVRDDQGAFAYCVNKLLDVVTFQSLEQSSVSIESEQDIHDELDTVSFLLGEKRHYAKQMTSQFLRRQISSPLVT
ncbi:hypothetical protein FJ444_15160 [Aestuariibacter sp. GS-14]|uniref:chemotaxis protein CheW n=1 Tax=Aestuariibacter sp. GS-14 TaxID=2590670 RepID=UPI001128205B|nr:chemotaxis protein CheW [Aestuariibacter sp. GS-14]TPV56525.1 hypothetical protein FJ444_15160 [Aestuariibacter sp. GS-14]